MAFKMKGISGFKILSGKTRRMKLARKYELEDREEAREQSLVSGFKSKADVINMYASGIGDALAGLSKKTPSKEERKEKKRQGMEDRVARDFKRKNK